MKESRIHEERRNEIIDAAQQLFLDQGFEKTSIAQIAKQTGCAKGLFYYYFETKEELLPAIAIRQSHLYLKRFKRRLCKEGLDAYSECLILLDTYLQLFPHRSTFHEVKPYMDDRLIQQFHVLFTQAMEKTFDKIVEHLTQETDFKFSFTKETLFAVLEGVSYRVTTCDLPIETAIVIFAELLRLDKSELLARQSILKNI